jgi:hypothetical protein
MSRVWELVTGRVDIGSAARTTATAVGTVKSAVARKSGTTARATSTAVGWRWSRWCWWTPWRGPSCGRMGRFGWGKSCGRSWSRRRRRFQYQPRCPPCRPLRQWRRTTAVRVVRGLMPGEVVGMLSGTRAATLDERYDSRRRQTCSAVGGNERAWDAKRVIVVVIVVAMALPGATAQARASLGWQKHVEGERGGKGGK